MKIIVAQFKAKFGKEDELKQVLNNVAKYSQKEEGVINYRLFQDNNSLGYFFTIEEFKDQKSVDAHMETAHVKQAIKDLEKLLAQDIAYLV